LISYAGIFLTWHSLISYPWTFLTFTNFLRLQDPFLTFWYLLHIDVGPMFSYFSSTQKKPHLYERIKNYCTVSYRNIGSMLFRFQGHMVRMF
jgi:hypothetical protein